MNFAQLRSLAMIVIFDVGGPLAAYSLLRSAGFSAVTALVLSGAFPAIGVIIAILARQRSVAVGVLVLSGIVVGAVLGLVSRNPRLVLDEGSVPTAVFGLICLGSLATGKPLIYLLVLQFIGPDSPQGREFTGMWQYDGFRRIFRFMTIVWGGAFLVEAAARVVIVQTTSPGTALAISKFLPYAVAGVLIVWTICYGHYRKREGERQAAAAPVAGTLAARQQPP